MYISVTINEKESLEKVLSALLIAELRMSSPENDMITKCPAIRSEFSSRFERAFLFSAENRFVSTGKLMCEAESMVS